MIILDSTSLALRGYVHTAPRTTNLDYTISWADHTSTTLTPGVSTGTLSSTTATDLVAAPAASTQRQILEISIYNPDTQPAFVVLLYTSSVTVYTGWLQPQEQLHYTNKIGFYKLDRQGARILATTKGVTGDAQLLMYQSGSQYYTPVGDANNLTTNRGIVSTNTQVVYLGPYTPKYPSMRDTTTGLTAQIRYRVDIAAVTITWAEVAVYAGNPTGGDVTLRLLGWTDVSAVVNSTGQKTTTVNLTQSGSGNIIPPGIGLWAAFGNEASTVMSLRAAPTPRPASGINMLTAFRPSTAGNTVAMTELTSGNIIWCSAVIE